MEARLQDHQVITVDKVDKAVFLVDASGPGSCELVTKCLWLPDARGCPPPSTGVQVELRETEIGLFTALQQYGEPATGAERDPTVKDVERHGEGARMLFGK